MKCVTIIACLVAFVAAQQKSNFRGQNQQQWGQKKQQWGQQGNSKKQQWGQKRNPEQQWGQKGNQQQQNKNRWSQKGKWTQQFYNKEHKCTVTKIPANLRTQYQSEFKALDVDNNNYLDSKEFKDEGAKISDAFSNFRKGKKPTWYHKGHKNGNNDNDRHHNVDGNNQNGGHRRPGRGGNQNGGQNGGGFGGFGRGGDQNRGQQNNQNGGRGRGDRGQRRNRGGHRQLADKSGADFWKYLQSKGFVSQKPKQSAKDRMDSMRAAQVFRKFDQDHNNKVSLCEYENAMYRTEMLEKRMSGKRNNGIVVVHG